MVAYHKHNQYTGVNAHLNSYLQNTPGAWERFQLSLVVGISRALNENLPKGYYAICPESLQMREYFEFGIPEYLRAVTYGTPDSSQVLLLDSLAWIEVISSSNKPPKFPRTPEEEEKGLNLNHHSVYVQQRQDIINAGVTLVEIDLLHEQHPVLETTPSYKNKAAGSYPFHITITAPSAGVSFMGLNIGDQLPVLNMPLKDGSTVAVDLQECYDRAFLSKPQYGEAIVDYEQPPVNFEAYAEADRERIEAQMQQAVEAV